MGDVLERRIYRAAMQRRINQRPEEKIKIKARGLVQAALRRGDLVKQSCIVCGNTKAEAHHEDYAKPLQVEWLCRMHHAERHGRTIPAWWRETIERGLRAGRPVRQLAKENGSSPKAVRDFKQRIGLVTDPWIPLKGEAVPTAKITEVDVRAIRLSPLGCDRLAKQYGVDRSNIRLIRKRKTWAHVV